MTPDDELDVALSAMADDAPAPAPTFVDGLESHLRATHAARRTRSARLVWVPALAGTAAVLVFVLVALGGRDDVAELDSVGDGRTPTTSPVTTGGEEGPTRSTRRSTSTTATTTEVTTSTTAVGSPTPTAPTPAPATGTPGSAPAGSAPPLATVAPAPPPTTVVSPPPSTTTTTTTTEPAHQELRLVVTRNDAGFNVLRWSAYEGDDFAGWRVLRVREGERQVAHQTPEREPRTYAERPPATDRRYGYQVLAIDADRHVVARSRIVPAPSP